MGLFDYLKRMLSGQRQRSPQPQRSGNAPPAQPANVFTSTSPAGSVQTRLSPLPSPSSRPKTRPDARLALDASQFAPISSSDALSAARNSETLLNNPWWGRLDTIPPATDERTLLIDRTLVAYGYFSPEELVEIHKIGDQMLAINGDRALADIEARAAVAASDAERQRIKAEKKAAAAERKRLHAEGVKRRKATDIIFLGRGVSRGLSERHRRTNVEKLEAAGLPVLATPADVASAMRLSIPRLRWLAFHSDASEVSHYVRFTVPKKSGGVRELAAPHRDLAAAQRWIFENILRRLPAHPAAHGFVKSRSIVTNATAHVGQETLVNVDLENFFPTITFHRVRGALEQLGYSPAVATIFGLLATEAPRREVEYAGRRFYVATGPRALPQGACTSPALSNLIARRLDSRLAGIAAKLGWRYTRYADDMSFSADNAASPREKTGYLLARIRHIVQEEGFSVNEAKTRVLKRSAAMKVTGLVVNDRLGVSRREIRALRAILHNARKHGLASQNRDNHPHFESQLRGRIAFVEMVNPDQARDLVEAFQGLSRL